jgi:hypothetical protein
MSETTNTTTTQPKKYNCPSTTTMSYVFKLAIVEDKPIMMDYWVSSLDKTSHIGVRSNNESLLVKSNEEFTSPISKKYKSGTEFIVITENSIYIVSADIPHREIK